MAVVACASASESPAVTDEPCAPSGATEACYPGAPTTRGIGECRDGSRICVGDRWSTCQEARLPSEEVCGNAADDDCDGIAEEGCPCSPGEVNPCYEGPAVTRAVGACADGTLLCAEGTWSGDCSGQVLPVAEICNGADDDCNGAADDCGPDGCPGCGEAAYCDDGGCVPYVCGWVIGLWGPCNPSCGPGTQTRTVECVCDDDIVVSDEICEGDPVASSQDCNLGPCCDNSCPSHAACGTNDCGNSCGPACEPHGSYSTTCIDNRCIWEMGCDTGLPCNTTCYWGESTCVGSSVGSCSDCVDPDDQRGYCWPNE